MNLRGHIQPVRAPPPSAASPPAPVSLGSSLTAPPGPVRRVRRGPLLTVPPPPPPECVCAGWEGCGSGEESPREGAACSVHRSLSPALWAPSAPAVLSAAPCCAPQVSPRGHPGPHGASARPLVAQPGATDTASAQGPPAGCLPAWPCCPCWPRRPLFAQAPRQRRNPASCRSVTVSPVEPTCARRLAPAKPSPLPLLPLLFPRSWRLGPLGTVVQL